MQGQSASKTPKTLHWNNFRNGRLRITANDFVQGMLNDLEKKYIQALEEQYRQDRHRRELRREQRRYSTTEAPEAKMAQAVYARQEEQEYARFEALVKDPLAKYAFSRIVYQDVLIEIAYHIKKRQGLPQPIRNWTIDSIKRKLEPIRKAAMDISLRRYRWAVECAVKSGNPLAYWREVDKLISEYDRTQALRRGRRTAATSIDPRTEREAFVID